MSVGHVEAPGGVERALTPALAARLQDVIDQEPPEGDFDRPVAFDRSASAQPFTLARFLRPHLPAVLLGLAVVAAGTIAQQAGPLLVQRAIDDGIVARDPGSLAVTAGLYAAAALAAAALSSWRLSLVGHLGQRLMEQLRIRVFTHLQLLSQAYFINERVGRLMTRMTSDIDALRELLQDGIINMLVQAMTLVIVISVLFSLNAELATIVVAGVVPVMTVLTMWFRRASDRTYALVRERIAAVLTDLQENLAGIREITAFNRAGRNAVNHRAIVERHRDATIAAADVQAVYSPSVDAIGAAGEAAILLLGGRMVLQGELTIGELTAFVLYLSTFFAPIQQLVNLYNTYQSGRAAVVKLAGLLGTSPTVVERPDAAVLPPIGGQIAIEDVTFGYLPTRPVLEQVSLHIDAGETIALVGPTGAGKSTLAKLLTRTYDPDRGRITVDGQDLREVTIESLRRQIGIVPQEPFLFAGSVRDNLTVGAPDAPDDELERIVELLNLDQFLTRMPDGIDSPVSERGVALSSGERQLIALGRALLPQPRVLVLDEATSTLDLRTEKTVEEALDAAVQDRTAVIVAHRLSTAMRADRIVVVRDGGIAEVGNHSELVMADGHYARMHAVWMEHGTGPAQTAQGRI